MFPLLKSEILYSILIKQIQYHLYNRYILSINHVPRPRLNTANIAVNKRTSHHGTWVIAKFISQIRTLLRVKMGAINNQTRTKLELC